MRLNIAAACAEASTIWKRDRDVIAAVGGVFFFLPNLAMALFARVETLTVSTTGGAADDQALLASMQSFLVDNAPMLAFQMIAELAGVAVLLALLLDPTRPTVGEALQVVARRLPVLIGAMLLINIALVCGMALFIVPGLYVIGRAALVLPVLVAEPERRFGDAVGRAIELTRGRVIQLLSLWALIFVGAYFVQTLLQSLARAASSGGGNPVTLGMVAVATSAVSMATAIAYTLTRAAIYRRLASNG